MKKDKTKSLLIEQLKKTPIIQIACEKTGVARASFYRWKNEGKEFAKSAEEALLEGEIFITEMSESQLISMIKDGNFQAVQLWLRHHHPKYSNKVEITATLQSPQDELTPEQEAVVREALHLALPIISEEKIVEDNKIINNQNIQNYEQPKQQSTEQQTAGAQTIKENPTGQKPTEPNKSTKPNEPAEKPK